MLFRRKDEFPDDVTAFMTLKRSVRFAAGGSTAERCTQPVRPKVPTAVTLTAYSTVVVVAPDASVATAATCAVSLRMSRAAK